MVYTVLSRIQFVTFIQNNNFQFYHVLMNMEIHEYVTDIVSAFNETQLELVKSRIKFRMNTFFNKED